ncbi:MAG TPA: glutamine--fructose-6-phosphate transaminase (isomerizing) [Longimicrobiales bacterium]|nr:glutamine--fructose-6-phosphate transaminase (isomerizing) [Longimicrobiales bacterium]
MCGIVGYIGTETATPILISGLKRLEYRGYDSAGITVQENGRLETRKAPGKITELEKVIVTQGEPTGHVGIAHTRWATHGQPNRINAHPHEDCSGTISLVHNGIIENAGVLRRKLEALGHQFSTETDTEAVVHLIEEAYEDSLEEAVRAALRQVEGTYGLAIVSSRDPEKIVVARKGSPLLIGVGGKGEFFVASDVSAVLAHTREVIYLDDGEMAVLTDDGYSLSSLLGGEQLTKEIEHVSWDLDVIEKSGHEHFMLKEIFEQPETIRNSMRGRILEEEGTAKLGGVTLSPEELNAFDNIVITACGTSWHSALIGEYMLEDMVRIPVEVEYASEFRYRNPIVDDKTLLIAISQSGETADTLAAMREGRRRGATVMGIVNVVGSTIARESDFGIYLHAGPEIGVASTKAFTSQLVALTLFTVLMGRLRNMSILQGRELLASLARLPDQVEQVLELNDAIRELARTYKEASNFLYLGRGPNFPSALEGALKLKEISYIHAEGYPAAEMKHGPIALIDRNMPVVVIAPHDSVYSKVVSNVEEVKARGGRIIAVVTEDDRELIGMVDHAIPIPHTHDMLTPILAAVPLQLLAYHIAVMRGCNVDQPRNLAKSVTVE